jgi:hypothetical protein
MAVDRNRIEPKRLYLNLNVDSGSWSRWCSAEHPHVLPTDLVPSVLADLDDQALEDFVVLIRQLRDRTRAERYPDRFPIRRQA